MTGDLTNEAADSGGGILSDLNPLSWINDIASGLLKVKSIFGNDDRNAALQAQIGYNGQIAAGNLAETKGQAQIETTRNITLMIIFIFAGVIAYAGLRKK
jgi:hypothetical protein